jgi:hypothetical protein
VKSQATGPLQSLDPEGHILKRVDDILDSYYNHEDPEVRLLLPARIAEDRVILDRTLPSTPGSTFQVFRGLLRHDSSDDELICIKRYNFLRHRDQFGDLGKKGWLVVRLPSVFEHSILTSHSDLSVK